MFRIRIEAQFLMLNEVVDIVSQFEFVPKRLLGIISGYIFFLTIAMKRHSFRQAGQILGPHESRFCALMNDPETPKTSKSILSRTLRRRIARMKKFKGRLTFIIDATIKKRRGKNVENIRRYHHGSGLVMGQKFVNFVILDECGNVVPIESIPVYTMKYCLKNGIKYRTEIDVVVDWLKEFPSTNLISQKQIDSAVFLLDAGYDAKEIQKEIKAMGSDFVMALKSSRTVNGRQVAELFRRTRKVYAWEAIRLQAGNGGTGSRRNYSIRTAHVVNLKGFGPTHVVCSKADHNSNKPKKYLVTSSLEMTGRDVVEWYTKRWKIETWHREMKQNYGFIDCHSARFTAIESHVNFSLTAYLLQKESGKKQKRVEEYVWQKELLKIQKELRKYGSNKKVRSLVSAALQAVAA